MYFYLGLGSGDLAVGWLCEKLRSRKKTLYLFYGITALFLLLFFLQSGGQSVWFYLILFGLGFGAGFNIIYLTSSVEQFGTNLRATATISISNFVRGSLPLLIILFKQLRNLTGDYVQGAWITGLVVMAIGLLASISLRETYGKDLDFMEE
jgi:MFS transporter, putative metabolite:H+ symporter